MQQSQRYGNIFSHSQAIQKKIFLENESQVIFTEISGLPLAEFFNMSFPHDNMPAGRNVDCR